jgi:hypothetical protein
MNKHFSSIVFALVVWAGNLTSQVNQTFTVDVWQAIQSQQATVEHSMIDIGSTGAIFDGNPATLARSAGINPMVVTLVFKFPISTTSMNTLQTHGSGWWTVEVANSAAELDNHSGAYQLLFSQVPLSQDVPSTKPVSATAKAFRLTMRRTTGDNYVHLNEWGITATTTRTITSLCFQPNQLKMIPNASFKPNLKAVDNEGNIFPINSGAAWSSSNPGIAAANAGTVTSGNATGDATISVNWSGLTGNLPMKVVNDFSMTLAPQRTVKVALVIIDPPIQAAGGQRFSQVHWNSWWGAPHNFETLSGGNPQQLANKIRDTISALTGGVVNYQFVEIHDEPSLFTTFGGTQLTVDSMYHLFQEPGWTTLRQVAEQQNASVFQYNELLSKYNFCQKSNNKQIDEVWVYAMPFIGMYESNMTGTGAFWINGPVITGNACTDLLPIMGFNYERSYDLGLHNFGHRIETTMYKTFGTNVRYVDSDAPYPPGTERTTLQKFMGYDKTEPGNAHVGNVHFPPNGIENYGYSNSGFATTFEQNWKRYPFLFQQTRSINCSDWNCDHEGFMRWWLRRLPKFKCKDKDGYLNNWWAYVIDYNEAKTLEGQTSNCDCPFFDDAPPPPPQGSYCQSLSNFPWEDWIAGVKVGSFDNPSGKSTYSDFTGQVINLTQNVPTPVQLTAGFSYFTWNEHWTVWIDYNHDGVFSSPNEVVQMQVLQAPPFGTPTAGISGSINVPASATTGLTRMRVSMKRGTFASACETLPFGEVEDYTVNIQPGGAAVADLELSATGSPTTVSSGTVHYKLTLTNKGPATATGITIRHSPSANFSYYSNVVAAAGTFNQPTRTWSIGSLGAGVSVTLDFDGLIVDQTTPQVDFFEVMTASPDDPDSPHGNDLGAKTPNEDDEAAVNLVPTGAADLIVTNLNVPAVVQPGSTQGFTFTVQNTGGLVAPNVGVRFFFSTDNVLDGSDLSLGFTFAGTVPPMGAVNGSSSFTTPAGTLPGNYFLIVMADDNYAIFESNENNNTSAAPIQVSGGSPGTYCPASSNFPWEDWVARVKVNDLDNTSSKSPYSDFTFKTAQLKKGLQYTMTLTAGFSYTTYDEYWKVWIDFNRNGVFENDENVLSGLLQRPPNGTVNASLNQSIVIPDNIPSGTTRMRVIMQRDNFPTLPCGAVPFGEVEDYTVDIQASPGGSLPNLFPSYNGVPLSGTPGQVLNGEFAVLNNGTAAVSGTYSVGWFFSWDNALGPDDQLVGSANLSNTPVGVTPVMPVNVTVPATATPGTYYLFMVVDKDNTVQEVNEFDNAFSGQFTVLGSGGGSYCPSVSAFPWHEWISSVKINDLELLSGKSNYSDFTGTTFILHKNSSNNTVEFTGTYSYFVYREEWRSWVDFNHNGVFEDSEVLFGGFDGTLPGNGLNVTQSISGKVGPFPNALTGPTRMRVSMKRFTAATPCEEIPFGEVEDYTVMVTDNFVGNDPQDRAENLTFEAAFDRAAVRLYGSFYFPQPVTTVRFEKSADGTHFDTFDTGPGKALPDAAQFVRSHDGQPSEGVNYYRLALEFANGEVVYSAVRVVHYESPADFTLFPNPATSELFIQPSKEEEGEVQFRIYDARGSLVYEETIAKMSLEPHRILLENTREGMYYLHMLRQGKKAVGRRFAVVR